MLFAEHKNKRGLKCPVSGQFSFNTILTGLRLGKRRKSSMGNFIERAFHLRGQSERILIVCVPGIHTDSVKENFELR